MTPSAPKKSINITGFVVLGLLALLLVGLVIVGRAEHDGPLTSRSSGDVTVNTSVDGEQSSGSGAGSLRIGSVAPDFSVLGLDDRSVSLSEWRGRPVLINFWATWCGPCEIEMPTLQEAHQAHKEDGLIVLAVAVDDTEANVRRFFEERDLTIQPLMDDGSVSRAYQVFGLPTSFFVSEEGTIAAVHTGLLTKDRLEGYLSALK